MATEKPKEPVEFRFDYSKFDSKQLTVEKLDKAFESFMAPATSTVGQVVLIIKLVAFSLYAWTRRGLVNDQMLIEKQEYERKRTESQLGDLAEDDLDQLRSSAPEQEAISRGDA